MSSFDLILLYRHLKSIRHVTYVLLTLEKVKIILSRLEKRNKEKKKEKVFRSLYQYPKLFI